MEFKKAQCEYLRSQAKQKFDRVRGSWIESGKWVLPHRTKWLLGQEAGERANQHIVDPTHLLAHRSYVAGFLEGNTSASRPWFRHAASNPESNEVPVAKGWLQTYTKRTLNCLSTSNFYHSAAGVYSEFGVFNSSCLYVEELKDRLHFHNLDPGSYYAINNGYGEAVVLVREFSLTVKALVDTYGKKTPDGSWDWSHISSRTRKMYEDSNYVQKIECVHLIKENEFFNPMNPIGGMNRKWISLTYELGGSRGQYYTDGQEFGTSAVDPTIRDDNEKYLKIEATKRKPFILARSESSGNFEYGEKGPTTDALGLIKSLNKKAIAKDQALEQMLRPALQGPASLKKSYLTTASNSFVPLDATSVKPGGGLRTIFEINPAIGSLLQDQSDLRQMVDKLYYADYLLYLSKNPKTRTATETNAIVQEQQRIIGPNLQSLNWTFNVPLVEFVMDYVLDEDPFLPPPPEELAGQFLKVDFISIFAQAQKAADMPSINEYIQAMMNVSQMNPAVLDKVNLDKYADLLDDRLYLPEGLNNPQAKVDAKRQQAQAMMQKQQMMQETLPALAGAAKDVGIQVAPKK